MQLKQKVENLLQKLNEGVVEKEEAMRLALLSAIAGESIFLLGPPGVAKSLIARRLKFAFKDATNFEYLMNRFSTPDEIFGPVSISKLKNEDKYERIVKNYLPSADVVFLDEIWKAGPSIQNTLLTVINEKIYRNGEQEIKIPLKALIAASNELPAQNEGLEALWDRFLVRVVVNGIQDEENFNMMIAQSINPYEDTIDIDLKITQEEYQSYSMAINQVQVPENIFKVIHSIRTQISAYDKEKEDKEKKIYISDRRWHKIIRLLRTSAFLNGRDEIDLTDCFLIHYCIWNTTEQISVLDTIVENAIKIHFQSLEFGFGEITTLLENFKKEIQKTTAVKISVKTEQLFELNDLYEIINPPDKHRFVPEYVITHIANGGGGIDAYLFDNPDRHTSRIRRKIYLGKDEFHVKINKKEYKLKTYLEDTSKTYLTPPTPATLKKWNDKAKKILHLINQQKKEIEKQKSLEFEHFSANNLFVEEKLIDFVEEIFATTTIELEKLVVELRQIQEEYNEIQEGIID